MMSYLNYKKKIEFETKEYNEIHKYCKKKKIKWFASAWDTESQIFLKQYKSKVTNCISNDHKFKIPRACSKRKKNIYFNWYDIRTRYLNAVKIFKRKKCPFVLMHCVLLIRALKVN